MFVIIFGAQQRAQQLYGVSGEPMSNIHAKLETDVSAIF